MPSFFKDELRRQAQLEIQRIKDAGYNALLLPYAPYPEVLDLLAGSVHPLSASFD